MAWAGHARATFHGPQVGNVLPITVGPVLNEEGFACCPEALLDVKQAHDGSDTDFGKLSANDLSVGVDDRGDETNAVIAGANSNYRAGGSATSVQATFNQAGALRFPGAAVGPARWLTFDADNACLDDQGPCAKRSMSGGVGKLTKWLIGSGPDGFESGLTVDHFTGVGFSVAGLLHLLGEHLHERRLRQTLRIAARAGQFLRDPAGLEPLEIGHLIDDMLRNSILDDRHGDDCDRQDGHDGDE